MSHNNSTPQRKLRYWQPNLRTVTEVYGDFPNTLYNVQHPVTREYIFWSFRLIFVLKLEVSYEIVKNVFSLSSYGKNHSSMKTSCRPRSHKVSL
jgi:hypothetical protein